MHDWRELGGPDAPAEVFNDSKNVPSSSHKPSPSTTSQPYNRTGSLEMSYPKWCALLVSNILKTRTSFASYLTKSISLSQVGSRTNLAPTFFPIPVPMWSCFDRMPATLSQSKRRMVHLQRAVHTMCMALNFWHAGSTFGDMELLRREPNDQHRCLYGRLVSIIRSEGLASSFSMVKSGRRFPNLVARLGELSDELIRIGGSDPYKKTFAGVDTSLDEEARESLRPFRDLDADRLTLHGTGSWDATSFLSDYLVMPYREPLVLQGGLQPGVRPKTRDSVEQVARLAKKWDQQGLLHLHAEPVHHGSLVKVFNCYKNIDTDRQIGDRRGQNSLECRVGGPSRDLPSGSDMTDVYLNPRTHKLCLTVTDRKDFYHQLQATKSRARSNTVGPGVPKELLEDCEAFSLYCLDVARKRRRREFTGDFLEDHWHDDCNLIGPPPGALWVAFGSIFQGDHAGVEICTEAHASLLESYGLLSSEHRLVASRPLASSDLLDGLVIDDYFSLSVEPKTCPNEQSRAMQRYQAAQRAYVDHKLLGSPAKDVLGENEGRAIGAYFNSSSRATSRGLVTLSSPPEKRLAMSWLTLQACALGKTTDIFHLCLLGGWVSMLSFRRPMMCLLHRSFHLVDMEAYDPSEAKICDLPRVVAEELVLLAVLAPLMLQELSARFDDWIYATDASIKKGAVCKARAPPGLVEVLFKFGKSKGAYTRLLSQPETLLRRLEIFEESDEKNPGGFPSPQRPLAFSFDFLEIFAGSAKVTSFVAKNGMSVGQPIDLSYSEEFDVQKEWVMRWLSHLISNRLIRCFAVEPPCTSFSIMRRPRLRSQQFPFGFSTGDYGTKVGNELAHRAGQNCHLAANYGVVALWETPFSSYMRHLPIWKIVSSLPEAEEFRSDSCSFGSPHLKSFRFLCVNASTSRLRKRCQCSEKHVQIQGSLTKGSAVYVDGLAEAMALMFIDSVALLDAAAEQDFGTSVGLENQLVNEAALCSPWELVSSWTYKKESHINILEEAALLRLVSLLGKRMTPLRIVALVDSNVVRGATSKGRTSSRALSSILRRVNASMLAFGLYVAVPYCPTRWNVADDPTRDVSLRSSCCGFGLESMEKEDMVKLASFPPLRRWASNWLRLTLLIFGLPIVDFKGRAGKFFRMNKLSRSRCLQTMDFDATLGYPGEGPPPSSFLSYLGFCYLSILSSLTSSSPTFLGGAGLRCAVLCAVVFRGEAMVLHADTAGDRSRASLRALNAPLPEGRPVLARTGSLRAFYFATFIGWCESIGIDFPEMLASMSEHIEDINLLLVRYGRELYQVGKTYNQYAETLNELSSRKPQIRRFLQSACDLGYSWKRSEPSVHHVAMPAMVLLGTLSVCISWGWMRLAGCFALMWGGLLRPGELCKATRRDLLLPSDLGGTIPFCILSIGEPKTRYSSARHQSAKVDIEDLVATIGLAFRDLRPHHRLWPYSAQTLRLRLRSVLSALWLPVTQSQKIKPLDLGSFRPGGATHIIQMTEDGDLLQRRGRWANRKMMEIYVQEVSSLLYLKQVDPRSRQRVLQLAGAFPDFLQKATAFTAASIPTHVWYILLTQ